MDKRERPVRNAITLLSIALLIILFLFILIFYVYYDQIFYSKTSPSKQNSYSTRSYNDKSQNCVNLLVPYTERETYMEKVPAYSLFNAGHYNNDNLNYKVIVNQESMPENSRYITELITIKIENRDNDDGYFDISVVFSPENENKITKHKSKFIREDESEKFEFEKQTGKKIFSNEDIKITEQGKRLIISIKEIEKS